MPSTHGHADHFLGVNVLRSRYPHVKVLATKATIAHIQQQLEPAFFKRFWVGFFPDQTETELQEDASFVEALPSNNTFEIEGHLLEVIQTGHTDTFDTTAVWVSDLRLVICGDVVYGDVHLYMAEAKTKEKRFEWVAALNKIKSLQPEIVVAGHKLVSASDDTRYIDATIEYIKTFQSLLDSGIQDSDVLYEAMMKKYRQRANDHALLGSCWASKAVGFK